VAQRRNAVQRQLIVRRGPCQQVHAGKGKGRILWILPFGIALKELDLRREWQATVGYWAAVLLAAAVAADLGVER
jgi:hypothetical protein